MSDSTSTPDPAPRHLDHRFVPVKRGLAEMLKGGVIMDVVDAEQARIAEEAGATAVMALERVPADIRAQGGVARMSDPSMIEEIIASVSIPVMAKARIGHFVEAQVLQELGVDTSTSRKSSRRRLRQPHRQVELHHPLRVRCDQPRRSPPPHHRGRGDDRSKGEAGTGDVSEATSTSAPSRRRSRRCVT